LPEEGVTWPRAAALFGHPGGQGVIKCLKYRLRRAGAGTPKDSLIARVAADPAWRAMYRRTPSHFYPPLCHFMDRRLGMRERFAAAEADLQGASQCFGERRAQWLASGRREVIARMAGEFDVCLGVNDLSIHEGVWALSLRDGAGRRLYSLSFSFGAGRTLLVGSVQGPRANEVEGPEAVIRDITKRAEGLRPPHLLFEALRGAARAWGIGRLLGIDPINHIKGRWNMRAKRLRFDYRQFWQELGGHQQVDGHWQIPLDAVQREAEDIPARKRAMYRRRYALIDSMTSAVFAALSGDEAGRQAPAAVVVVR
jgi:uncharacterized protein VirK/YbjX